MRRPDFWLWPSKEVANPLPQKATINLDKMSRNSHFITLVIHQQSEKHYSWKTAELWVRTEVVSGALAWGCSHLLTTPSSEGGDTWSQQERLSELAPLLPRSKWLIPFAVVGNVCTKRVIFQVPSSQFSLLWIFKKQKYSFVINIYTYYRKGGK